MYWNTTALEYEIKLSFKKVKSLKMLRIKNIYTYILNVLFEPLEIM